MFRPHGAAVGKGFEREISDHTACNTLAIDSPKHAPACLCVNSAHAKLPFPSQHPHGHLPVVSTNGEIEA
jgi:hypothetical protein